MEVVTKTPDRTVLEQWCHCTREAVPLPVCLQQVFYLARYANGECVSFSMEREHLDTEHRETGCFILIPQWTTQAVSYALFPIIYNTH